VINAKIYKWSYMLWFLETMYRELLYWIINFRKGGEILISLCVFLEQLWWKYYCQSGVQVVFSFTSFRFYWFIVRDMMVAGHQGIKYICIFLSHIHQCLLLKEKASWNSTGNYVFCFYSFNFLLFSINAFMW
jgi:hypothetical protein